MQFSAAEIADILGGEVEGNPGEKVNGLSKIQEGKPGKLTFLANPKYTEFIYSTEASVAIVGSDFKPEENLPPTLTLIRVSDSYAGFAKLLEFYNTLMSPKPGIDESASIHSDATIGADVHIGANCSVEAGVNIGDGAVLHPGCHIGAHSSIGKKTILHRGCLIMQQSEIGAHCELHAGVVIGSDGFGFAPNAENFYNKVPQTGNVIIEDHVDIGANTVIDRATLGSTIIRKGVKLDNLIQVAHNVDIGENTVIAAQTGIAGSTTIGKNCMIGGQVGIIGHLEITDGVKIAAQSGIGHSILEPDSVVQGSPAFSVLDYKKSYVGFRKLPEILTELNQLKRRIDELENNKS
jgi:UDP-3-O-[3-hydroxymyristoyl] glucosamine N-acyltransferase